jgi:hypothetical protein
MRETGNTTSSPLRNVLSDKPNADGRNQSPRNEQDSLSLLTPPGIGRRGERQLPRKLEGDADRLELAASVSATPRQEADFQCAGLAGQGQLFQRSPGTHTSGHVRSSKLPENRRANDRSQGNCGRSPFARFQRRKLQRRSFKELLCQQASGARRTSAVRGGELALPTCAVKRRRFPVGARPTRQPLQPEATGAVMEVTKWLKPSGKHATNKWQRERAGRNASER